MQLHEIGIERRARFYTVGDLTTARAVWVVLHGHGQLAAEFAEACQPLVREQVAVVAPEALNRYYKERPGESSHADTPVGATWMTREFRVHEIRDYVAYLDRVAAHVAHGRAIQVLGFSQGAVTGWRWVTSGRTPVQRFVSWAGELPKDIDPGAIPARVPGGVDLVLGDGDEFRAWIDREGQVTRLAEVGVTPRLWDFAGGHRLDRTTLEQLASR